MTGWSFPKQNNKRTEFMFVGINMFLDLTQTNNYFSPSYLGKVLIFLPNFISFLSFLFCVGFNLLVFQRFAHVQSECSLFILLEKQNLNRNDTFFLFRILETKLLCFISYPLRHLEFNVFHSVLNFWHILLGLISQYKFFYWLVSHFSWHHVSLIKLCLARMNSFHF